MDIIGTIKLFWAKVTEPKSMFMLIFVTSSILFLSSKLNIVQLDNETMLYFLIFLMAGISFFLWDIGEKIITNRNESKKAEEKEKIIKKTLIELDNHEKSVLREFLYFQKQHTLLLPILNHAVSSLEFKSVIERINDKTEQKGNHEFSVFKITEPAYSKITNEIIGIHENMSNEDIAKIKEMRLNFIGFWESFYNNN